MFRRAVFAVLSFSSLAVSQVQPPSDPQALSYAAQSIAAMTGGVRVNDVTLTGTVTWNGTETGTAVLAAIGRDESRIDLALSTGTRTEVRDGQGGVWRGRWANPTGTTGEYASHNCWTDATWFFPALSSISGRSRVVLAYVRREMRHGTAVQHLRSYTYQGNWPSGVEPSPQRLSTIDFFLDAATLLPVAITFNVHPDNDAATNLRTEVDFAHYQAMSGVMVPTQIRRYQQGALIVDLTVTGASFNTGLSLSTFAIN